LIFGRVAEEEFDDHIVNREDVVALRRKVQATVDNNIREESADVTAILKDGRKIHVFVEHAIGSVQRPMTDAALEAKFHGMSDVVIGADKTNALLKACWNLGHATDVHALTALTQA
jgi:2-methylcitrate dehydratase PrpD